MPGCVPVLWALEPHTPLGVTWYHHSRFTGEETEAQGSSLTHIINVRPLGKGQSPGLRLSLSLQALPGQTLKAAPST